MGEFVNIIVTGLISFIIGVVMYNAVHHDRVISGKNFKIDNATYKCVKTNELIIE